MPTSRAFTEIANLEGQTAGAITARIMLPKHPMPTIPLTKAELADLAAYILSLRDGDQAVNLAVGFCVMMIWVQRQRVGS